MLRDALRVLRELQARRDELLADIQIGIEQADRGLAGPLDLDALVERCSRKLAEEGIAD